MGFTISIEALHLLSNCSVMWLLKYSETSIHNETEILILYTLFVGIK